MRTQVLGGRCYDEGKVEVTASGGLTHGMLSRWLTDHDISKDNTDEQPTPILLDVDNQNTRVDGLQDKDITSLKIRNLLPSFQAFSLF